MIALFTDFGVNAPYVGQMKAVLMQQAVDVAVIDLFHDAPPFRPMSAAYLLPSYVEEFPAGTVFLCVVDPGVGGKRKPVVVRADGRWFVGPDNGLLNEVSRRALRLSWWDITWQPEHLSASFHGRDLFAPVAAGLVNSREVPGESVNPADRIHADWPQDLFEIVYIDRFGNALTGARGSAVGPDVILSVNGHRLERARTFSDVPARAVFWYENANGLIEIAANQASAAAAMGLEIGMLAEVASGPG
ncbi:MAG: SAM-dependent chlorinase/fluorinase [Mariprofundaceae bacterium]